LAIDVADDDDRSLFVTGSSKDVEPLPPPPPGDDDIAIFIIGSPTSKGILLTTSSKILDWCHRNEGTDIEKGQCQ
jgi:hypothetical protein